jgi:RNA recognition motif-containing protein
VTEFQLLKVVEPFGRVVRFDFMYSSNESGERLPRGYAFVTYEDYVTASEAIKRLNGVKLMNRELKVQPSSATHIHSKASSSSLTANLPLSLSMNLAEKEKKSAKSVSKLTKIRAMEAKLMALKGEEDFKLQIPSSSSKSSSVHQKKPYDRPNKL